MSSTTVITGPYLLFTTQKAQTTLFYFCTLSIYHRIHHQTFILASLKRWDDHSDTMAHVHTHMRLLSGYPVWLATIPFCTDVWPVICFWRATNRSRLSAFVQQNVLLWLHYTWEHDPVWTLIILFPCFALLWLQLLICCWGKDHRVLAGKWRVTRSR